MRKAISVVIPTKDRVPQLRRTLGALERQEGCAGGYEVIVVDNGSAPQALAEVRALATQREIPLKLIEHPQGGPAAARNAGVAAADGEAVLLLGDDTEPERSDLVAAHAALHAQRPEETYAVLGRITWSPRNEVTPFMRWLEDGGPQFHYAEISAGPVDAATYLYSSHVSLKRSLLERVGGFDERFPSAALEDTELGVRLRDAGIELDYHPELLVHHDHPTTPRQWRRRAVAVGRSAALYNSLKPHRPHERIRPPQGPAWTLLRLATPILPALLRLPLPDGMRRRVWLAWSHSGYAAGYRLGPPETMGPR